jgi:hypothetical protein
MEALVLERKGELSIREIDLPAEVRAARRWSLPEGQAPALRTRRLPRQDRKALRKPWVSVQEGRLRRFGLSRGNPVTALRDGVSYWSTAVNEWI